MYVTGDQYIYPAALDKIWRKINNLSFVSTVNGYYEQSL